MYVLNGRHIESVTPCTLGLHNTDSYIINI